MSIIVRLCTVVLLGNLGSFSPLKRLKTYLRSTTGDSRLNHLMMLHVHKDRTDALTLVDLANDFVGEKENRKQLFGKFSANDIPNTFLYFVKVHTNGKLETKTKGIVDKCSDLACTKKYALRGGGGGLIWATRSAPPVILCSLRACGVILKGGRRGSYSNYNIKKAIKSQKETLHIFRCRIFWTYCVKTLRC